MSLLKINFRLPILFLVLFIIVSAPVLLLGDGNTARPLSSIVYTKHNLSGSLSNWPAPANQSVRAVYEPEICIFCHTPHNADPAQPLWNHEPSAVETYRVYWSNTLKSYSNTESQAWHVDGYSKLCLSCHDGTVAIGSVRSRWDEILMASSNCIDASGKLTNGTGCSGYIGTDLSGGHPISIIYTNSLVSSRNNDNTTTSCWLNPPPVNSSYVRLYPTNNQGGGNGVQCTSCHNPHTNRASIGSNGVQWPPLWQGTTYNEVCLVCHDQDCGTSKLWPW